MKKLMNICSSKQNIYETMSTTNIFYISRARLNKNFKLLCFIYIYFNNKLQLKDDLIEYQLAHLCSQMKFWLSLGAL